jgi:hypothetical protein
MDQESARDYYARVKVPFPDNRVGNFDGMVSLSFNDELKRELEARKILGEKQLWFRDYSLLVLKKMRKIVEIWTSEPDRVETKAMAALLQRTAGSPCWQYDQISQ